MGSLFCFVFTLSYWQQPWLEGLCPLAVCSSSIPCFWAWYWRKKWSFFKSFSNSSLENECNILAFVCHVRVRISVWMLMGFSPKDPYSTVNWIKWGREMFVANVSEYYCGSSFLLAGFAQRRFSAQRHETVCQLTGTADRTPTRCHFRHGSRTRTPYSQHSVMWRSLK